MNNFKIVDNSINYMDDIKKQIEILCIENNINKNKQNYKILVLNETIVPNNLIFTSGSRKTLSFYGRVCIDAGNRIKEKIYEGKTVQEFYLKHNSLIIIRGGTHSSTEVEKNTQVLSFYIAPESMVSHLSLDNWQLL